MDQYILGISCFFHDSAACILRNGEIIAAAQEERFTRIKHDPAFPRFAINYCLEEAGISEKNLNNVAFYENANLLLDRITWEVRRQNASIARQQFTRLLRSYEGGKFTPEKSILHNLKGFNGTIKSVEHHHAHAAAAFYPSPFSEAAILTIDGVGEWASSTICHGHKRKISLLKSLHYPNSLGLFYSAATYYLGFKINSGEYKVMGLAPYGEPKYVQTLLDEVINISEDGSLQLNPLYFDFSSIKPMATPAWDSLFNQPRRPSETHLTQFHMDVAASAQEITEIAMLRMARHAKDLTGAKKLCLSGGVALNCVGNGKILRADIFDDIWIQPASGDAGNALGAALCVANTQDTTTPASKTKDLMKGARLGPAYSNAEIKDFLELYDFPYEEIQTEHIGERISTLLTSGHVIGLFEGRMEFGPRALGGRSIIGDPRDPVMQEKMNLKIKFRESFRPFAPIVREENASEWFDLDRPSPYMLLVAPVKKDKQYTVQINDDLSFHQNLYQKRSDIGAVTHVDYSARIQTVPTEPITHARRILDAFYKETGIPVLINTSFNVRSEPIVATPMDAYRCMMRSRIDAILMENILVLREQQPEWKEEGDWRDQFETD